MLVVLSMAVGRRAGRWSGIAFAVGAWVVYALDRVRSGWPRGTGNHPLVLTVVWLVSAAGIGALGHGRPSARLH